MNDVGFQPGPVTRPVGLETEFGVLRPGDAYANPVVLSTRVVEAYSVGAGVPTPPPLLIPRLTPRSRPLRTPPRRPCPGQRRRSWSTAPASTWITPTPSTPHPRSSSLATP